MSIIVGKTGHSCGSRRGLNLYEEPDGRITGWCFSCKTFEPDPLGGNTMEQAKIERTVKSPEEIQKELEEIAAYPVKGLDDRKIGLGTMNYFGCKVSLDQERQEKVEVHYYPYEDINSREVSGYKVRVVEGKKIFSLGSVKNVYPFGWKKALESGSPRLYITEGEIDAMSLFSVIMQKNKGTQYEENIPAVVSVPHGAASASRDIGKILPELRKHFKEVVLVFDQDDAGRASVADVHKILPEAKVANVPGKDVNECVLNGHIKALINAVMFQASTPKNTRVVMGSELAEAAKERPQMGLSWPWDGMTKLTRGIRRGEVYYIGSGVKMGKSEVVNALAAHMMIEHDSPVFLVKPEEDKAQTYKRLVGKVAGRIFHDPDIPFDEEAFDAAEPMIGDKAIILDSYQFVDWKTLKLDISYVVKEYGVKDIIIDPITVFTAGMNAAEANDFLIQMSQDLAAMAKDLDFTAYIFCHLKAPTQGEPHERGGEVLSTQFTGSRGMMRSCHMMIGMSGNKSPDIPEDDRNIRKLTILEDRAFGASGSVSLYWNKRTGQFVQL
ncbi:MAG: primase DnaG/twinkle, TOPRIM domain [Caudoviricetes sp.]|nr:MAG: primase DnaG/twinkle, TOPRIM domain [Caudoviricetes sp.]